MFNSRLPRSHRLLIVTIGLAASLLLPGCDAEPRLRLLEGWRHDDLLAMDPIDAPTPGQDLVALYKRTQGRDIEIRVDYLDLELAPDHDLTVRFDTGEFNEIDGAGESQAEILGDLTLTFPAEGVARALGPDMQPRADLIPRILRHPGLDAAVISLNLDAAPELAEAFRIMVVTTRSGETQLADGIDPVSTDADPPPPAPLLLAFWDAFPAYTPAQALRRWQGAHTGPFGGRHGLNTLVEAAEEFRLPVTLLDLKNPKSLSALDFLGQVETVKGLAGASLFDLPDAMEISSLASEGQMAFLPPEAALLESASRSRAAGRRYGLPASQALYAPVRPAQVPSRYTLVILPPSDEWTQPGAGLEVGMEYLTSLRRYEGQTYLPLPAPGEDLQAHADGLGLPARAALVAAALNPDSWHRGGASLVVLGGDLPLASWGDPEHGRATIEYITAHPWIRPLGLDALVKGAGRQAAEIEDGDFPAGITDIPDAIPQSVSGEPQGSGLTVAQMHDAFLERLASAPESVWDAWWDAYFTLLAPSPPESPALPGLRQGYFGQMGSLLAASEWAAEPGPISDCSTDPDLDGALECILATDEIFLLFESEGARLTHAYLLDGREAIQWIAPFSQFISGLGDPSGWQPDTGPAGDPGDVPGAFSDAQDRWSPYSVTELRDRLIFASEDGSRRKTFELTPSGVKVRYEFGEGVEITTQIPLALAPGARFSPAWRDLYEGAFSPSGYTWSLRGGPRLSVQSTGDLAAQPFLSDELQLEFPEDPNYDYPPGHLIPFPFVLLEASGEGQLEIEFSISD